VSKSHKSLYMCFVLIGIWGNIWRRN
jgi:hypothetical protein